MKRLFLLFICFLFVIHNIRSENDNYSFWTIDIDKGLSNSYVTSILLDDKATLWVGTACGLNRYDRYELKSYFNAEGDFTSIPNNNIVFIAETPQNTIWVSTSDGLVQYDKTKDRFVLVGKNRIYAYSFYCADKEIWFGGINRLYKYDYKNKIIKEFPLSRDESFQITRIYEWEKDKLLLITRNSGIWKYDCRNGKLYPFISSSQLINITAAYMDAQRNLYVSVYRQGLFIFDRVGKLNQRLTINNSRLNCDLILDIIEKNGYLWLATDGGGINVMNLKPPYDISHILHIAGDSNTLPGNSINRLYKDKQQNIWAGSVRTGVVEIKETFIQTYKEVTFESKNGLTNKAIGCLCKDDEGFIWIGTDGGGVNRFDPVSETFKHFSATSNEKAFSLVEYSSTELLLSIYNKGVFRFNKETGKCVPFIIINEEINNQQCYFGGLQWVYRISDNKFLFLGQIPYVYYKDTGKFVVIKTKENLAALSSLTLVSVDKDIAYLRYGNRILKADMQTDSLSSFFTIDKKETIQVIDRDINGIFWLGTNLGLRRYDPLTKTYEKIQTNLFKRVSAVIVENGTIWIGAENNLFSYNTGSNKFRVWQESDGYLPNELPNIFCTSSSDPYIYIGGSHGLVRIKKNIESDSGTIPEIQMTDVMLNGFSSWDQLKENKYISIPWNYKSLQLKITSLEKDVFKKRLFKYTVLKSGMKGQENKVIESYDPVLNLDMLTSGEYLIRVSCYTDNGNWSTEKELLQLVVIPPWYRDYRIMLPIGVVLVLILVWQVIVFIRRKEEKMKWKMSEVVQRADQEKINFLINISHELRTPLTLIYAPLRRIMEKVETEMVRPEEWKVLREQLTSIHRSSNQMKDIINMTLDVNRINDEENILHKLPHTINEWICSVAEEFKYEYETKQVTLVYVLDENAGTVEFDDHKCESVLSNMLMNALKFAPEKSRITLSSTFVDKGVRISVSDQGKGLGDIDSKKLFTRFYQGKHNRGGSGIGLSYSKVLIEKHGGKIGAYSNSDCGATFFFELPITTELLLSRVNTKLSSETSMISFPLPEEEIITIENFSMAIYSVVVVEDNDELRHFLVESLQKDFGKIYQASDGQAAWKMIAERMPDIVISDIMMPLMDGYELCKKVKTENLTNHIPVVLLTARADTDSTITGYKLGADAYVPKPFDLDFLLAMLRNLLRNREMMKLKYRETFLRLTENSATQSISNVDEEFMLRFNKLVIAHLPSKELNIQFLTEQMGMSRSPLYAKLKALTNLGINDYVNRLRIEKASELLKSNPELTISEISDQVGFEYQRYFSTLFKQIKGMTPTQFRQQMDD